VASLCDAGKFSHLHHAGEPLAYIDKRVHKKLKIISTKYSKRIPRGGKL